MALSRASLAAANRIAKEMMRLDRESGSRLLAGLRGAEETAGVLRYLKECHPDVARLVTPEVEEALAAEDWRTFKARIFVFTRPAGDAPHTRR